MLLERISGSNFLVDYQKFLPHNHHDHLRGDLIDHTQTFDQWLACILYSPQNNSSGDRYRYNSYKKIHYCILWQYQFACSLHLYGDNMANPECNRMCSKLLSRIRCPHLAALLEKRNEDLKQTSIVASLYWQNQSRAAYKFKQNFFL